MNIRPAQTEDPGCDQSDRAPLVLDVDDALLHTDLLHETAAAYIKGNPLRVVSLFFWLLQGKAVLKRKLSERVALDVSHLPVSDALARFASDAHAQGRMVGLATAADELLARRIGRRFDFIDFVIASDGIVNLKGACKAAVLSKRFPGGFAYAGDSHSDLKVWQEASSVILAGASASVTRKARSIGKPVEAEFKRPGLGLRGWAKALRLHQWAKNTLVFVPLILSGMAADPASILQATVAFLAMSLMASGTYLFNDLADLSDDRKHWTKRNRPLASGKMRIKQGAVAAFGLIAASYATAAWLGWPSLLILFAYMAITLAYSFHLKRLPILDVFTLAVLFTLRLCIGITAVGVVASPWLLVFSMFLFTSLSFAKRLTEIQRSIAKGRKAVSGRGYVADDAVIVLVMGVATAMAAITIMVLYIMNDVYRADFYKSPILLWAFPAVLFMWISRIWLLCHRKHLDDDPVAFAVRDRTSLGLGALMGTAFLIAWLA